ncbi:MAG: phosphatidate cytidylyltransferase [Lachnospiraceae bacterium]|jgi:phosphatidate cytidylyltransferase|nr:phosphatidate cytidylyltransferase [Lachnospiraceae bacterium]
MFTKRLASGIVLLLVAVLVVSRGGWLLFAFTVALSFVGLFELYRVMKIERHPLGLVGYLTAAAYFGLLWFDGQQHLLLIIIGMLMVMMTLYVVTFPRYATEEVALAFFGVFYVAVLMSFVYQVRAMPDGQYMVWLIILSAWGCDTCAYCVGMLIGRHPLTPQLSPKKSVEGAIGGILGAAALGYLYGTVLGGRMEAIIKPALDCAVACGVGALISQVGDLAASAIKRNHDVKDYGDLIPGHGGVLDRFDSILFTAPAVYFAMTFLP